MASKRAVFVSVSVFVGLLILAMTAGVAYRANMDSGRLINVTHYDNVATGDSLFWGIFDEYTQGGQVLDEFKAAIEAKIISTEDVSFDHDSLPDLSVMTSLILGETDVGRISSPLYLDIYSFTMMLRLYEQFSGFNRDQEYIVPSMNALHLVSSEESYVLQKVLDILIEKGSLDFSLPDFSMEGQPLGEYPDALIPEDEDSDNLDTEDANNYAVVANMTAELNARHNAIKYSSNKLADADTHVAFDLRAAADSVVMEGNVSFFIKCDDYTNSRIKIWHGESWLGVNLVLEDGVFKYVTGNVVYDGSNFIPATLNEEKEIGDIIHDNNWHKITIQYDFDSYTFDLTIDETVNPSTGVTEYLFRTIGLPLYLWAEYPPAVIWGNLLVSNVAINTGTTSVIYVDDVTINNYDMNGDSSRLKSDVEEFLLKYLSFFHVSILPDFNYNILIDFITRFNQLADGLFHFNLFDIINTTTELRFTIRPQVIHDVLALVDEFLDFSLLLWEGDASVTVTVCWDKRIDVLNESYVVVDYNEIGVTRKVGLKLIATTLEDAYPNSPSVTDYSSIFQNTQALIDQAKNYVVILVIVSIVSSVACTFFVQWVVGKVKAKGFKIGKPRSNTPSSSVPPPANKANKKPKTNIVDVNKLKKS